MSTKQRIIEESTTMFTTYGVRSVRMDDIANALGISKRTIYETFGDKENLIHACVKYFFAEKAKYDCQRSAGAANIIEELLLNMSAGREVVERSFLFINDLRKFYPKIYTDITEEGHEIATRDMKEKLQRGIEQGVIAPYIQIDLAVGFFVDIMQAVFTRVKNTSVQAGVSVGEVLQSCVVLFARGIATIEGVRMIDEFLTKNMELK